MTIAEALQVAEKVYNTQESKEEREDRIRREDRDYQTKENRRTQKEMVRVLLAGAGRTAPPPDRKGGARRQRLGEDQCAYCKRLGHWKNECPERGKERGRLREDRRTSCREEKREGDWAKVLVSGEED